MGMYRVHELTELACSVMQKKNLGNILRYLLFVMNEVCGVFVVIID